MKQLLIIGVNKLVKPLIAWYLTQPTAYKYGTLSVCIFPGVFHPRFFFSTRILLRYFKKVNLKNRTFLELGAGSGLISLLAASRGAEVTASDISKTAVENILQNQKKNSISFPVVLSDLFNTIPLQQFDVIAINPPYYKRNPVTEADYAWYCGENAEYFQKLFRSLPGFIHSRSLVIMVLSDACDIDGIRSLAGRNNFTLKKISEHQRLIEKNFIFSIQASSTL